MIAYVVTEGSYSDYRICGVFSSGEKALAFLAENRDGEIEEWTMDERAEDKSQRVYSAAIRTRDGSLFNRSEYLRTCKPGHTTTDASGYACSAESVESPEHALKLAAEARQAWLREHGPTK